MREGECLLFFEFFFKVERIGEVGVEAVGQLGAIALCSIEGDNVDIIKVVIRDVGSGLEACNGEC